MAQRFTGRHLVAVATFAAVTFAYALWSSPASANKRVVLAIGNSNYQNVPRLPNPSADAIAMAQMFKNAGFDFVDLQIDLGDAEFKRALRRFSDEANDSDTAIVFFAGHGMEVLGTNYMIPIDAKLADERDAPDEAIALDRILEAIDGAKRLRLIILDACRDNPFSVSMKRHIASRGASRGLAKVEPQASDTLIAYAARAGSTAEDGNGEHSPMTTALLHNLTVPGLDIRLAFGVIRDEVFKITNNRQEPFVYGSLGGGIISLVPQPSQPIAPDPITGPSGGPPPPSIGPSAALTPGTTLERADTREQPVSPSALRSDLVTDCDRLAAHPSDEQRPPDVAGVFEPEIDIVAALRACAEAVRQYPDVARFALDSGRIAHAQKDYAEALRYFEKATGMGSRIAITETGIAYLNGESVARDYARARQLFEEADAKGDFLAVGLMGLLYQNGLGVSQDYARARQLYQRAADAGNFPAMNSLGVIYEMGLGVTKDYTQARRWFEKAAAADNPEAANNLGRLYQNGWGVAQDYAKARQFYERAATRGSPVAMYNLGILFGEGLGAPKDYAKARAWYEKAAAAGDAAAMDNLGVYYQNAFGGPRDYTQARLWYERAAAAGNAAAMNDLGSLYGRGLGVLQDNIQARQWYEKGAAAGNAVAMLNLGTSYLFGRGVARDYNQARQWYEKAAAIGNAEAMNGLGAVYENGLGVPKDDTQARQWYEKGAEGGSDGAKKSLERLSRSR
jgi:TPR repeat protein